MCSLAVMGWTWLSRACLAAIATAAVSLGGCNGGDGDVEGDGLHEEVEAATEDALTNREVTGYVAVAPPEQHVSTAALRVPFGSPVGAGRKLMTIRKMTLQGTPSRVVVDADSLVSSVVADNAFREGTRPAASGDRMQETPYAASLAALRGSAIDTMPRGGPDLGAAEPFAVTIDMCQSSKVWEKRLFEWAVSLSDKLGKPVPIGIAMTGLWARKFTSELDQILAWERAGKLAITWVNHSSTHPLHCAGGSCSFLTHPSVDMDEEVLGEERVVLARSMVPSPFFRFPGLTHDARRFAQLSRLSLMAIDADAWIAKGQPIKPRAVVLLHGNGNEPSGIVEFLRQVQTGPRAAALLAGRSALVPTPFIAPVPPR